LRMPDWRQADLALLRFYLARRIPGWQKPTKVDQGGQGVTIEVSEEFEDR
jgi:hypothetical protein